MADELKPMTMGAFNRRFHRNRSITGYGVDVKISMPCPFCAAADFMVYRLLEMRKAISQGATCKACGRSARAIFHGNDDSELRFEIVQTGGPQQPEWLEPKMRRL